MKVTFNRQELYKTLQILQRAAAAKRNSNTISGVLFRLLPNHIVELQANDFEIGYRVTLTAEHDEGEDFVITAPYLTEIIGKMPSDEVVFTMEGQQRKIVIHSGKSKFEFLTVHAEDFPLVKTMSADPQSIYIQSSVLKQMIDDTTFACASDESRPIFSGALLHYLQGETRMVATNTHRLAMKKAYDVKGPEGESMAIIPARTLKELSKLLPVEDGVKVRMSWNRMQITFEFGSVEMNSRLVNGNYPPYERVIPTAFDCHVTFNRSEIKSTVERAFIIAKDADYNVIDYSFSGNEVKLVSENPEIGAVEEYASCTIEGEGLDISFNSKYIMDILGHLKEEEIYFHMKDNGPMLVTQKGDDTYLYVVTPMRSN